jgi:hypothetical protein
MSARDPLRISTDGAARREPEDEPTPRIGDADVLSYPSEAILTAEQAAAWLQVSPRQFERLRIPCVVLGTRTRRYLAETILNFLRRKVA